MYDVDAGKLDEETEQLCGRSKSLNYSLQTICLYEILVKNENS